MSTVMPRRRTSVSPAISPAVSRSAGPLAVLFVWQILATTVFAGGRTVPSPVAVAGRAVQDLSFALPHIAQTAQEAAWGWLWGNLLAIVAGVVFVLVKPIELIAFRFFVALYCLPLVAIAPILTAVLEGDDPQIVVAAQGVFFTTLVAVMLGFRSTDATSLDLVAAAGGGRWRQMRSVRVWAALPALFGGLRIAAPAAVLGAVIGEYLGGRQGLGVAMVYSQQTLDATRTWGLALYAALLAGVAYGLTAAAERLIAPWARSGSTTAVPSPTRPGSLGRRTVVALATGLAGTAFMLVFWQVLIKVSGLSPFFAKTPLDVWAYLSGNLDQVLGPLAVTLRNAALGYAAGTVAAVMLASLVVVSRFAEAVVMPIAVTLRTVPLVAMTPLIALVFGRDVLTVIVIAGLVTFFPCLVTVVAGMRATPQSAVDLIATYGGGPLRTLATVRLPYGMASIFAASRVAAPTALLGALLAEWLATGQGLGFLMLRASVNAQYNLLWSAVVLVTAVSIIAYAVAAAVESSLLRRFS
ncbi:ABC transporter permease [Nonomuraea sp. NPDC049480]|uniref:ABC transporter permease n=1 Tax=Nonomuraea sp. NPDC049480 TaxID=3364353 RepID=UPI00378B8F12